MPHKKQKRSLRDAATAAAGYDNAPTAGDSIPHPNHVAAASSSKPVGVLAPETKKRKAKKEQPKDKKDSFGGRKDLGGLSKNMHRILNAGALREEYQQNKKRKLEEEESKKNPNQKKVALTPLPYESLGTFNRRVEMALRPSIDTAIRASKASAQKKKAKKAAPGEAKGKDGEQEEAIAQDTTTTLPSGKVKPKATPSTSVDPFVPRAKPARATEFEEASQRKSVTDVVQAPPVLSKAGRKQKTTTVTEPLPASRMPVSGALKAMMEQERLKAVAAYRAMKEQREKDQKKSV